MTYAEMAMLSLLHELRSHSSFETWWVHLPEEERKSLMDGLAVKIQDLVTSIIDAG